MNSAENRTAAWYSDEIMGSLDSRLGGGKKMNDSELLGSLDSAAHVEIVLVTEAILRKLRVLHCAAVEETLKTMPKNATVRNFADAIGMKVESAVCPTRPSSSATTLPIAS
ncbi:MAG: hypothetical protein AAB489_02710 [Patescibacteria group bacterium]